MTQAQTKQPEQSLDESRIPVLIGAGQITDKQPAETAGTPIDLMVEAARRAARDSGREEALLQALDTVVAVGLVVDSPGAKSALSGTFRNVPLTVSNGLGIKPGKLIYTDTGGNTPQKIVNKFAEQIAQGISEAVLLTGAEALNTMISRLKQGMDLDAWQDDPGEAPTRLGEDRGPVTPHELLYGLETPAVTYPLFENALRGKYGLSLEQHKRKLGELYQRFNQVAAANPLSWFPTARSAEEIAEPGASNRYVGFPYTKYLNSVIQVNMGAAVIMISLSKARELGVADDRMVYLHGCADGNDIWYMNERADYSSSPAVRTLGEKAMAMAGKTIDDMSYFDIYSCFPSAVQIACDELGIAHDDPRGLTVTGGLPYFGGPGNNYVMHSIATMMDKLRADPGSFGLLNANGWFVTKHSLGIYSTTPPTKAWQRENPEDYQAEILAQEHPPFTELPVGTGTIETYTVVHNRQGLERGIVIGRLEDGTRFLAETSADAATLEKMMAREMLGVSGTVSRSGEKNLFVPDFD